MTMFILSASAQRGWNRDRYYRDPYIDYGGYGVGWGGWNGGLGNFGNGGIQITSPIGSFSMNFPNNPTRYERSYCTPTPAPCPVITETFQHAHNENCYTVEPVTETHRFRVSDTDGNFLRFEKEIRHTFKRVLICGYP